VIDRKLGTVEHARFHELRTFLNPGDLLVLNRTRVIAARLHARRASGGRVELLLVRRLQDGLWEALAKPSRRLRLHEELGLEGAPITAVLQEQLSDGLWRVQFAGADAVDEAVLATGTIPFPPYIAPDPTLNKRYQTVYADTDGSVAAPTAGLHFSPELLAQLQESAIQSAYVTLHVGLGTFRPITAAHVKDHVMHREWGELSAETAQIVQKTRSCGGRTIAVGTTSTRVLETAVEAGETRPWSGETDLFIYPGYQFQSVDALITNFHLPKSTLLMLVSAFAGRDLVMRAYREAVTMGYRFYSFGDAMLIL